MQISKTVRLDNLEMIKQKDPVEQKSAPLMRHCMIVHAYYPLGETRVERALDDGEFLEVLSLTPDEVERDIRAGVITDAKTIAAYYLALPLIHASTGG